MAFSVSDLHDLIRLLETQPEWRAELRRLLISNELLDVPQILRGLAQAQERTEAGLAALTERVDRLAQAQERTEAGLAALAERVDRGAPRVTRGGAGKDRAGAPAALASTCSPHGRRR